MLRQATNVLTCEEADEDEPGRADLLPRRVIVHHTPHSRFLVLALLLLRLLVCLGRPEQVLEVRGDRLPLLPALLLQERRVLIDLVIPLARRQRLLDLLDHLADGLVGLLRHQEELQQHDDHGHDKVGQEESSVAKSAACLLEDDPVDEEEGARGIESACQQSKDEP